MILHQRSSMAHDSTISTFHRVCGEVLPRTQIESVFSDREYSRVQYYKNASSQGNPRTHNQYQSWQIPQGSVCLVCLSVSLSVSVCLYASVPHGYSPAHATRDPCPAHARHVRYQSREGQLGQPPRFDAVGFTASHRVMRSKKCDVEEKEQMLRI